MEAYLLKVPWILLILFIQGQIIFLDLVLFLNLSTVHSRLYFPKMATKIFCMSDALLQCDLHIPSSRNGVDFFTLLYLGKTCPWTIKYTEWTLLRHRALPLLVFWKLFLGILSGKLAAILWEAQATRKGHTGAPRWQPQLSSQETAGTSYHHESVSPAVPAQQNFQITRAPTAMISVNRRAPKWELHTWAQATHRTMRGKSTWF